MVVTKRQMDAAQERYDAMLPPDDDFDDEEDDEEDVDFDANFDDEDCECAGKDSIYCKGI